MFSDRGLVRVTLYEDGYTGLRGWVGDTVRAEPGRGGLWAELTLCDPAWPRLGIGYHESGTDKSRTDTDSGWRHGDRRYRSWIVPYWLLAAAAAPRVRRV